MRQTDVRQTEVRRPSLLNAPEQEQEFKCYMIWQMMIALLHSNGQLRTERDGDTEKGCQEPAVQQKTTHDIGETCGAAHGLSAMLGMRILAPDVSLRRRSTASPLVQRLIV